LDFVRQTSVCRSRGHWLAADQESRVVMVTFLF
jgi:hypothetical protein